MTPSSQPVTSTPDADTPTTALVGVLGGMGPAATVDFYAKLVRHTPAQRDQDHLRVVIWADPTVPDRVGAVLGGGPDPYPALLAGAQRLRSLGATVVAMPCNTAHFFLDRLVRDTGLAFVDMVGETVAEVVGGADGALTIGLLGTRATLRSGLYQLPLADAGAAVLLPSEEDQRLVDTAIAAVKAGDTTAAAAPAEAAARKLAERGAQAIVRACTELPLALAAIHHPENDWNIVDPTDVLARATVRQALS